MKQKQQILQLLGLAVSARMLMSGEELVVKVIRNSQC